MFRTRAIIQKKKRSGNNDKLKEEVLKAHKDEPEDLTEIQQNCFFQNMQSAECDAGR